MGNSTTPNVVDISPSALAELDARLDDWTPDFVGTLLFVHQGNRVLLMHKQRGHGAGMINAPGGKVEPGESPLECARRETLEELCIDVASPQLAAKLKVIQRTGDHWLGYVYLATSFDGEPRATAEGIPQWFDNSNLPFDRMWPDDQLWLPRILAGERLSGAFLFNRQRLITYRLEPLF